jgi:hypothetical protein
MTMVQICLDTWQDYHYRTVGYFCLEYIRFNILENLFKTTL